MAAVLKQQTAPWTLISAALAPVLLIGGWTVAAARQPHFDARVQTISALAALDARDRWIMTAALIGLGLCHLASALGLRAAGAPGRVVLALGGTCIMLVAAFPLAPGSDGRTHVAVASAAFFCLAVWPLFAMRHAAAAVLRPPTGVLISTLLLLLLAWLAHALHDAHDVGLVERVAAAAQALWPLAVVLGVRQRRPLTV